ncbi:MAG: DUF922 domain-containing protein [Elusimicrobia bacterium]|nr:DUF922 domain-containing protein [Elusimicrobiota bacterium]
MKQWLMGFGLMVVGLTGLHGEDGLRIPSEGSGTTTKGAKGTTVRYPFGSVHIPSESLGKRKTEVFFLGKRHARTLGSFRFTYVLAREKDWIVARNVRVRVENKEEYLSPVTAKLREHESMHGRINVAEAARIEGEMKKFRVKESDPAKAEKILKTVFQGQMDSVKKLHTEWDGNHTFIQP